MRTCQFVAMLFLVAAAACGSGAESRSAEIDETPVPSADRGYRWLLDKPYLPADFDQQVFDELWRVWPEPLRSQAEAATPERRRHLAFQRYGLTVRPDDSSHRPLQYVVDEQGRWHMNCFACHGGQVLGQPVPGAPNADYALQTLTEEVRETKLRMRKPLSHMDLGSLLIPLGATRGTSNAVMFGVVLLALRDADLNLQASRSLPALIHHDLDAPPWWHFRKKQFLYIDGFAAKGHRALMQFMLVRENGPEKFREWEQDFRDVYAWMESLEPPRNPFPIDADLARAGAAVFDRSCAECHGTYGPEGSYPERLVRIDEVQTDRVRLEALTATHREHYAGSWFADYGQLTARTSPGGYVAPPLDGVWASPPYFHNGSVPTLWHVLHPDRRPIVWRRTAEGYDRQRVGLAVEQLDEVPAAVRDAKQRREYFDTRAAGKSAAGHEFPNALNDAEKLALLEYLKTL